MKFNKPYGLFYNCFSLAHADFIQEEGWGVNTDFFVAR